MGFYLGMIHGGNIDPNTLELNKSDSICKLTDLNFTYGYHEGRQSKQNLIDLWFAKAINSLTNNPPSQATLAYELGGWIGNLSLVLISVMKPVSVF